MAYTLPTTEQMDMEGLELGVRYININGDTVTATAAELNAAATYVDALTATALELNQAADVSAGLVQIADAANYTFLATNSGKTHVTDIFTDDMAFALPAVSGNTGVEFQLFYGGLTAVETGNWIFTNADDAPFAGGLLFLDEDAGAADGVDTVYADGTDDTMTIVDPAVGTSIHFITNGTLWFVKGQIVSATIPTFTTTA